jgi:exosortase A-associated hydrolase 1
MANANDEYSEEPVVIDCDDDRMLGIVARPTGITRHAVLIVVGGPQYRIGSHRQFTLLARLMARTGIGSLRFDYRGMGDSEGRQRNFEDVARDIACAADRLCREFPGLGRIVLWGLCDAASATLMYAPADRRVAGLVLLNPWIRTEESEARTYIRHYYARRLLQKAFWAKILSGTFQWKQAIGSARGMLARASGTQNDERAVETVLVSHSTQDPLPDRMALALDRFSGPILIVLSGDDLTAREFQDVAATAPRWRKLLAARRVATRYIEEANHTFATGHWRDLVAQATVDWIDSLPSSSASTGQL